jgi:hypothetical protein
MFKNEPTFYGIQEDGRYKLYQYIPAPGINIQKLIIAENIKDIEDAKLIAKLLIQTIEQLDKK